MATDRRARISNPFREPPEGPALILKSARRTQVLALVVIICILSGGFFAHAEREGPALTLQNDSLRVEMDPDSGNFQRIVNFVTGQELLRLPEAFSEKPPWEISLLRTDPSTRAASDSLPSPGKFRVVSTGPERLALSWEAELALRPGTAPLEVRATVANSGTKPIASFGYPILYGIQPVGGAPENTFFSAQHRQAVCFGIEWRNTGFLRHPEDARWTCRPVLGKLARRGGLGSSHQQEEARRSLRSGGRESPPPTLSTYNRGPNTEGDAR